MRGIVPLGSTPYTLFLLNFYKYHVSPSIHRFYVAVLDSMGAHTVHPVEARMLLKVSDCMQQRGVAPSPLFYSRFVNMITSPDIEDKDLIGMTRWTCMFSSQDLLSHIPTALVFIILVRSIPSHLLEYCHIVFPGTALSQRLEDPHITP
jgi:hypothetical protein